MSRALDPELIKAWNKGRESGIKEGKAQTIAFFLNWLEQVEKEPGIGPKTAQKIKTRFYAKYELKKET
jgi:hypothetical protein